MKYLFLDYRSEFDEKYDNDIDLILEGSNLRDFENEINHLKKNQINIIQIDKDYGFLVIEDNNIGIPSLKLEPWGYTCSKDGLICEFCNDESCCDYDKCKSEYKYKR